MSRGVLVPGLTYHARTPEKALDGLRRKIAGAAWEAVLNHADLDTLVAGREALTVCVSDARAIGASEYGIRSWCHAAGLDYAAGVATVGEVFAAYREHPAREARAAILHALRRAKHLCIAA